MTVVEVAAELDLTVAQVRTFLGKPDKASSVTDEEMANVAEAAADGKLSTPEEEGPQNKPAEIAVFISDNRRHTVLMSDPIKDDEGRVVRVQNVQNPQFTDYRMVTRIGKKAHLAVKALPGHGIRELKEGPFEDFLDRAAFGKLLREKVLTGHRQEPSERRGMLYLLAWLRDDEVQNGSSAAAKHGPEALIEYITSNKHYENV